MINQKMQDAINGQIKYEMYAAHLYLSMTAYFETHNLEGMAHWMRMQSKEEYGHAMRLFDFLNERGGRVMLQTIEQPPVEFSSARDVFEQSLAHEEKVTRLIHELYQLAVDEKDYPSQVMLHWFIEEQVEEEQNTGRVVEMLKMAGDHPWHILMIDRQLASRAAEH
jgi:ferritin